MSEKNFYDYLTVSNSRAKSNFISSFTHFNFRVETKNQRVSQREMINKRNTNEYSIRLFRVRD